MSRTIEQRLDRLESLEAIRRLKHQYCAYCDDQYNADKLKNLFWDDAIWDAGPQFGQFIGPEAIASFFTNVSASIVWARHFVFNELIDLDEDCDSAQGKFQILEPCTFRTTKADQAAWLIGSYTESYRRREGLWKFQSLKADIAFISPYEKGWAKAKNLD